jgi:hypothetical protein
MIRSVGPRSGARNAAGKYLPVISKAATGVFSVAGLYQWI